MTARNERERDNSKLKKKLRSGMHTNTHHISKVTIPITKGGQTP